MLSEEERAEFLAMAGSASMREDCRNLRRGAVSPPDIDALLAFLSAASRFSPPAVRRPEPGEYPRALL